MDYVVDIVPVSHRIVYHGDEIGRNEFSAARHLLTQGAVEGDIMVTHRDGKPSMRGTVGWWAAHDISEPSDRAMALIKHRDVPESLRNRSKTA